MTYPLSFVDNAIAPIDGTPLDVLRTGRYDSQSLSGEMMRADDPQVEFTDVDTHRAVITQARADMAMHSARVMAGIEQYATVEAKDRPGVKLLINEALQETRKLGRRIRAHSNALHQGGY